MTIDTTRVQHSTHIVVAPTVTDRVADELYALLDHISRVDVLAELLPNHGLQFDVQVDLRLSRAGVQRALAAIAKAETDGGPR